MVRMGEITAVDGDYLEVTFCHQQDCGQCHACENGQKLSSIRIRRKGHVGDFAAIDLPTSTVVKASLLAYVIPLCSFLIGLAIGPMIMKSDPNTGSAIFGILFLVIAVLLIALGERSRRKSAKWQPTLQRIVPRDLRDEHALKSTSLNTEQKK